MVEPEIAFAELKISYTEAAKSGRKFENKIEWGIDLASEHERWSFRSLSSSIITQKISRLSNMKVNDDCKTVAATDVLVPKVDELIGGSQREEHYEVIQQRFCLEHVRTVQHIDDFRHHHIANQSE